MEDTIAAVSTSPGESGIGIVRLSGGRSLEIASTIFIRAKGGSLPVKPCHMYYGYIVTPVDNQTIDEVLLTYMKSPKSYTGEDVVEINCHGGAVPTRSILDLCLQLGARPAAPGEFTRRAFLNGRIDLAQAEAVIDVIKSRSQMSLRMAMKQLRGGLSQKLLQINRVLVDLLVQAEASLDFPEEDLDGLDEHNFAAQILSVKENIDRLLMSYSEGKMVQEGLTVTIVGRPNVGKSSLLNRLLQCERAIVTPVPGTTRDTIEADLVLDGLHVKMIDTAGLRTGADLIETEGIRRAWMAIEQADILVLLLDAVEGVTAEDDRIADEIKNHPVIAVINKIDLINDSRRAGDWPYQKRFEELKVSAKFGWGIEQLQQKLTQYAKRSWSGDEEGVVITRARHYQALRNAQECIERAFLSTNSRLSPEFLAADLREALEQLGLITGENYTEHILDRIFSQFCIGK